MNSKAAALLTFDEQLSLWMSPKVIVAPKVEADRTSADDILSELPKLWPFLLRILTEATQDYRTWPSWLRYAILATDRLILASRSIPLNQQELRVKSLMKLISDIDSKSSELIASQVSEEKGKFFSQYSTTESDVHKAVDYWPIWEHSIRELATKALNTKKQKLVDELIKEQSLVAHLDSQQAALRDKWSNLRSRLVAADSLGAAPETSWWGSLRKSTVREAITDWIEMPTTLDPGAISDFQDSLLRMQLATNMRLSEPDSTWEKLRASTNRLVEISLSQREVTQASGAALNIIDALLQLSYHHDDEGFAQEQRRLVRTMEENRAEIERTNQSEDAFFKDAVVCKFFADSREVLADAALRHMRVEMARREKEQGEFKRLEIAKIDGQLRQLKMSQRLNFEEPWLKVQNDWAVLTLQQPMHTSAPPLMTLPPQTVSVHPN